MSTSQVSDVQDVVIHGHQMKYRMRGEGPVLVLIHGVVGSSAHWEPVIEQLSQSYTVIAPDLLGHGASAKPRGDYSLGAYASGIRDLLVALGHERATVVGHSLGGGIALQFAYQFSHRCERLVLVSSGGLGPDVHLMLRAATLPGSEWVLPIFCNRPLRDAGRSVSRALHRVGVPFIHGETLRQVGAGYSSLAETEARSAFVHTLRSVVDIRGQRVDARDRLYLANALPLMLVWGANDPIIPVEHGRATHEAIPGSRFEVFENSGHFPQWDEPKRFARVLLEFLATTKPAFLNDADFREQLLAGNVPADPAA